MAFVWRKHRDCPRCFRLAHSTESVGSSLPLLMAVATRLPPDPPLPAKVQSHCTQMMIRGNTTLSGDQPNAYLPGTGDVCPAGPSGQAHSTPRQPPTVDWATLRWTNTRGPVWALGDVDHMKRCDHNILVASDAGWQKRLSLKERLMSITDKKKKTFALIFFLCPVI